MKTLALQIVTVELENGDQGMFVGWPLIPEKNPENCSQVENIWFSNIQEVPDSLTLKQLMELVRKQLCVCKAGVQ